MMEGWKVFLCGCACLPVTLIVFVLAIYADRAEREIMADKMYLFKKVTPD